jgi:hypothetical protein
VIFVTWETIQRAESMAEQTRGRSLQFEGPAGFLAGMLHAADADPLRTHRQDLAS